MMLIIGEKINVMNKAVYEDITSRQLSAITNLARLQSEAGADALDINIGPDIYKGENIMRDIVTAVQQHVDIPLCLNGSPEITESGLRAHKGRALINGITAEKERMTRLFHLAKEYNAGIIGMSLPGKDFTEVIDGKCMSVMEIVEQAANYGISIHNIYIDPIMPSFALDPDAVCRTIESIQTFREMFPGIKTIVGLNNISEGITGDNRSLMNNTALGALMGAGLDAAILDPLDRAVMETAKTGKVLCKQGIYCDAYLYA
jgi:5-methyltetrahydrofolate corrinoid/iron sulfur protein methyltransferase